MTVLTCNARSLLNKFEAFNSAVDSCDADIVAVTETWLHPNINDCEVFSNVSNFAIYRCDRTLRQGGGVLLAIKKNVLSRLIPVNSQLESIWSVVELGYRKFIFGVCYRPPLYTGDFVSELHDVLATILTQFPNANGRF